MYVSPLPSYLSLYGGMEGLEMFVGLSLTNMPLVGGTCSCKSVNERSHREVTCILT